jgi:hypothetical protein
MPPVQTRCVRGEHAGTDLCRACVDVRTGGIAIRQRVDVKHAAEVLGISSEGVRQRIRRGSLDSEKDTDGRVYVWLDNGNVGSERRADVGTDAREDAVRTRLEGEIEFLRQELATRDEEIRRRDAIMLNMTEGLKALNPPPDARDARVTSAEDAGNGVATPEPQEPSQPRSWLHRVFFGSL